MTEEPWYNGLEAVQVIGHSAYGGAVPIVFGIMDVTRDLGMRPVLLASHPDVVSAAIAAGYEVWQFQGITRAPRPLHDVLTSIRLGVALRRRGVRILHTHTSKGGMVGRLAGWFAGCDLVIHHTHGFYHSGLPEGLRATLMRALESFFARMDDIQVFVNSEEAREAVRTGVVPASRARVVFNGLSDPREAPVHDDFVAVRADWGIPENAPLIGSVSRLAIEQKGLDSGLHAFRKVLQVIPEAWYVMVGDGEDRQALQQLAERLDVASRVVFPGHVVGGGRLHECFAVTFAPSRREGQSVSVIEAMACGRPVVATAIPGTRDLVEDGVTGLTCPVDDTGAMSSALVEILSSQSQRDEMGLAARDRYERLFTREAFQNRIRDLYGEALEAGGRNE